MRKNIGQLANNRQLTTKDIKILNDYGQTQNKGVMGIIKKKQIEKLIDEEKTSEESARVELEVDMARERERERRQLDMFNDPYENWSGHR
tara:strand:- start:370 stop:639 length:270 start_codon:yes stop_codon:yes gene_type:complete